MSLDGLYRYSDRIRLSVVLPVVVIIVRRFVVASLEIFDVQGISLLFFEDLEAKDSVSGVGFCLAALDTGGRIGQDLHSFEWNFRPTDFAEDYFLHDEPR